MNIVYLIKVKRDTLPNKYIGSKSNCTVVDGKILDNRGKVYAGSSTDKQYKLLVEQHDNYEVQILAEFDNYNDALYAERDLQIRNDVVASPEFFNKAIAAISNYTDPSYATYKHVSSGKVARLKRDHPLVLSGEWVGVTKGVILTEEQRKKRGRSGTENGFFGKTHTEETKLLIAKIIGDAHRGKPKSNEHRAAMAEAARLLWAKRKADKQSREEESI